MYHMLGGFVRACFEVFVATNGSSLMLALEDCCSCSLLLVAHQVAQLCLHGVRLGSTASDAYSCYIAAGVFIAPSC